MKIATRCARVRRVVFVLLCLLSVLPAYAAPSDGVRARLDRPAVLRGQFEQTRHLHGFRNALVSQGDFVVARDRGVLWFTRKPFASTMVIDRQRVLTRQPDGSTEIVFDGSKSSAAGVVDALLLALLGGDVDTLSKYFALTETLLPDGSWKAELTPRKSALGRVFAHIVLQGDKYVRSVHLDEKGGDATDIRFSAMTPAPAQLQDDEARQFE
jgi:hypothetical protein